MDRKLIPLKTAVVGVLLLAFVSCQEDSSPGQAIFHPGGSQALRPSSTPSDGLRVHGTVYVPVYSSIHWGSTDATTELSATLSVRNTDGQQPLVMTSVKYFDSLGNLLDEYLEGAMELDPMATVEFVINRSDKRGGNGANFVVEWGGTGAIAEPVMEAVMLGQTGTAGISFVSQGRSIQVREPSDEAP